MTVGMADTSNVLFQRAERILRSFDVPGLKCVLKRLKTFPGLGVCIKELRTPVPLWPRLEIGLELGEGILGGGDVTRVEGGCQAFEVLHLPAESAERLELFRVV